jgi:hypothetical protein
MVRLCREGKPLKGGTLDVAAGRNKPARPVADQTVEGVRNAADGKTVGLETRRDDATG